MQTAEDVFRRIHITGASGAGTTTLGKELARRLDRPHHDTDTFYWYPTNPPFTEKRPVEERLPMMMEVLAHSEEWILSGSLDGWGDPLIPLFNAVIFVSLDKALRMQRLRDRENQRYGDAVEAGGEMHAQSAAFLAWSSEYDSGALPGRSRPRHEAWLTNLPCPVIRVDSSKPVDRLAEDALDQIAEMQRSKRSA